MPLRIPALLVAVIAVAAASGCGDATAIKAQFDNRDTTVIVYALNGTPVTVPSAIRLRNGSAVRIDANFSFDIAFDINAQGEAVVHTQRAVASQLVSGHRVGLKLSDGPYEAIVEAPTSGFSFDSSLVLPMGKVLIVDSVDPTCSTFSILGPNIRAKIRLDSVVVERRTIYLRMLHNPNCGFRSLTPGIPKE